MDEILNKVVKIGGIEQNARQIKFTDQEGQKFNFWLKKQDGENTVAYKQWKTLDLAVDSTVNVSYKEEQKEFVNDAGKTIKFTDRTVIGFRETNEEPADYHKTTQKQPTTKVVPVPEEKPDWEAITRGKVATNLAQGYLAGGKTLEQLEASITKLLKVADDLIKNSNTYKPSFEDELASLTEPQFEEDVNVENVPF